MDRAGRQVLHAVNGAAERAGVRPGQSLADALSVLPALATHPADIAADRALLEMVARWAWRFSPLSARDGDDGLWLDVTGCAHLFGGEAAMMDDMLAGLRTMGFSVRGALADTAGAAWALARYGENGTIVPVGGTRDALDGVPLAALRLDGGTVAALGRVGLRRIGDIKGIARASLASRFGRGVLSRLDQAFGDEAEALAFLPHTRPWRVRHAFVEPVGHVDIIRRALDAMLVQLCRRLAEAAQGCRALQLTCRRVDGGLPSVRIGTGQPSRDPVRLARLFAEKLDDIDAGFGIEALVLTAPRVEAMPPEQVDTRPVNHKPQADLADRLANRLGAGRVARAHPVESHLPDQAWAAVGGADPVGNWARHTEAGTRPMRLLRHPAPLKPLAPPFGGRAGDPPGRFACGVINHDLRSARGPEKITPNWWRKDSHWTGGTRDYWQVEDKDGRRLWIYLEVRKSLWFLHGLFV